MILIPGTVHQVTWSIQNLQDTTTYYVKAVIRDTRAETVLATLYLTNLGNGRFSKAWNVPQDGSGFGREIEIEKTVYEDAGYTIPSGTYGRWLDNYTIFNLGTRNPSTGGYGPGTSANTVDYKEIANIFSEKVDELKKFILEAEKKEEGEENGVDFTPVLEGFKTVLSGLAGISARISAIEEAEDPSAGHMKQMAGTSEQISASLKRISDSISSFAFDVDSRLSSFEDKLSTFKKEDKANVSELKKSLNSEMKSIVSDFKDTMAQEAKKISDHIQESLSKPIQISVAPPKIEPSGPSRREKTIKSLLS